MERIRLTEDLSFSRIIQGMWRLPYWGWREEDVLPFMNACAERGVTTFDTAEIYGGTMSETLIGAALKEDPALRGKIEIVSKTGIFSREINGNRFGYYNTTYDRIIESCKGSLKRLGTDYLDLYLIHREDPLIDHHEAARALLDLKKEGLVREIGVSNFDPMKFDALNKASGTVLRTNQIEWNPICFEHFESGMMDYLTVNRIHPMIWSPLAGGRIFGDDENAKRAMAKIAEIANRHNTTPTAVIFAWLMYHPVGAMPISGSGKLERLDEAISAFDVKLEHHEWYEIYTASGQKILR